MARPKLDIAAYNKKRNFKKTAEPKGTKGRAKGDNFVVQKHDATRLHWDFRLEMDGVLKSWAVPKGPSIDPDDKRLAVRTEDHPLSYGKFEGTIPQGEYGGGTVMLWDRGRWIPEPGKDPRKTIDEGHLHFTLEGERMKGEWVMFRLKGRAGERGENWMLKKIEDGFAGPGAELVERGLTSVTTGRTMAEIAAGRKAPSKAQAQTSTKPPPFKTPQLATLVDAVPSGPDWIHEYKYDGYRLLLAVGGDGARAWTRNGHDWTAKFAAIAEAAAKLSGGSLIDGEAVAIGDNGKPDFARLQATLKQGAKAELAFFAFDLLVENGKDITSLSNLERKERLAALLKGAGPPLVYGDHVIGRGEDLFEAVCGEGGEGIISKRAGAAYRGARGRNWLKIKCIQRQEFVIVGWSKSDKRRGFRALLLGLREGKALTYAGKVGTGFNGAMIDRLTDAMEPLSIDKAALEVPRGAARGAHWIKPRLVAEVAFTEFTGDGLLRHPSFIALRDDKPAQAVVSETPAKLANTEKKSAHADAASFGVKISNPDRVIFPGDDLTKGQLANYYAAVEALMMVDAARRPVSLVRCPQGRAKACFFQKHDSGAMGDAVKHVPIKEKDGKTSDYLYVEDAKGLLTCVQMGTIEFHGWGSRIDQVENPDRMVFDLDPDEGLEFDAVRSAAQKLHAMLSDLGLVSFPLLTGGKGVHLVVPLDRSADWSRVKDFAERFSRAAAETEPERFTKVAPLWVEMGR